MAAYEQFDKTVEEIRKSLKDGFMPISKMAKDSQKACGEMTPAQQQAGDAKVDKAKETTVPGDTLEVSKAKDKPNTSGEIKKPSADEKSEKEMSPAQQQQGDGKVDKPHTQKIGEQKKNIMELLQSVMPQTTEPEDEPEYVNKNVVSKTVFDNDKVKIIQINNLEDSIKYGKGTRWSISSDKNTMNYFPKYHNEGNTFYFLLLKGSNEKYAIMVSPSEEITAYNAEEKQLSKENLDKLLISLNIPILNTPKI